MDIDVRDIQILRNFIPNSLFFDDLLERFPIALERMGHLIDCEAPRMYVRYSDTDLYEIVDYFDGNGFIVKEEIQATERVYVLYPQYQKVAYKVMEAVEKLKAAVQKINEQMNPTTYAEAQEAYEVAEIVYDLPIKYNIVKSINPPIMKFISKVSEAARPPPFFYLTFIKFMI